jgi:hypothetical protein
MYEADLHRAANEHFSEPDPTLTDLDERTGPDFVLNSKSYWIGFLVQEGPDQVRVWVENPTLYTDEDGLNVDYDSVRTEACQDWDDDVIHPDGYSDQLWGAIRDTLSVS